MNHLVPEDKHDLQAAERAVALGYPGVEPVLGDLLEWLQDRNWPVARVLEPFLASIGKPLIPHIDRVFRSDDYVWQYWIVVCLIEANEELFKHYRPLLTRLATAPTRPERDEELDVVAREALEERGVELTRADTR